MCLRGKPAHFLDSQSECGSLRERVDLPNAPAECFNLIIETGVLHWSGAEKIPSNPIRIMPAWEVSEANRPSLERNFPVSVWKQGSYVQWVIR